MTEPEAVLTSSTMTNRIVDIGDRSGPPQPPVEWPGGREGAAMAFFTLVARLMNRHQKTSPLVRLALEGRLKHCAKQVFDAIVESGGELGRLVAGLLAERFDPVLADELLVLCDDPRYRESVPLMEVALVATRQVFELRRIWKSDGSRSLTFTTGEDLPPLTGELLGKNELARVANNLGARLLAAGRDEEAREALDMALTFRRELADLRPDLFAGRLADTLLNLANLEEPPDALPRLDEALRIYDRLAASGETSTRLGLVRSWSLPSDVLRRLGQGERALAAACQAWTRCQDLVTDNLEAPFLRAEVLITLGASFGACGHLTEAFSAYGQAVALLRELDSLRPDQARPRLARSLLGHSVAALAIQQGQQALDLAREAIALQRKLAEARPDVFLRELASGLERLGTLLGALGQEAEAASVRDEAQRIREDARARQAHREEGNLKEVD